MSNSQLSAFVERLEKLDEEKASIAEDMKSVFGEAKSSGYDVKVLKQVLSLRKKDANKRKEEQAILALYMQELGMLADLPLGQAAIRAASSSKPAPESDIDEDDAF